ncbi:hypothetical protein Pmani_003759 [Petrolisthes manimaculis]|uniref:Uncharacterized protein n=1 Tax=Petrolisthes manimaculis TaxID=1843537 RepID=A0AAE1QFC9_9EUCA|nr:hypothetical protein Pmani_003759 [Petrolisthes manimaculis]
MLWHFYTGNKAQSPLKKNDAVDPRAQLGGRRRLSYQVVEGFTDVDGNTELYLGQETLFPGQAGWPIPHDAPFKHNLDRCIMASIESNNMQNVRTQCGDNFSIFEEDILNRDEEGQRFF